MKCPKCGINLLEHIDVCPFCKTPIPKEKENEAEIQETIEQQTSTGLNKPSQNTGRYSAIDPSRDSYDFDLQYTLTFRDSGEIKQAIADMDAGISYDLNKKKISTEHKTSSEPRYTLEEMQAAALRAQERREMRKNGKHPKRKSSHINKRNTDALRAAKPVKQKSTDDRKTKGKSHKGLFIGAGVLVFVVAIIVGLVNVFAYFAHKTPEYPTVYTKGNELYSYYGGKEALLSSNFVTIEYEAQNSQNTSQNDKSSSSSKKTTEFKDPKDSKNTRITKKDLVKISEDGSVVYFIENVNFNTKSGDLVSYINGKKKSRTVIAQNVYYDFTVNKTGSAVLYLKNADDSGSHGELCLWNLESKSDKNVDTDITAGNFKLSQDSLCAIYIKNFNPIVHTGDLFYASFAEGAGEPKRLDEKVAYVFGTASKGKIYFYAKNYDTKTGTYDLYIQSDSEGPKALAEKGFSAPKISEKLESAYVYSNYSNNFQTLNYVDLSTGGNTKLAEQVTEIVKVRNDEGAVVFSTAYDTDKADYYFVSAKSPNPQKVATAINVSALSQDSGMKAFDTSDDFSTIAYIGGYDPETKRGALYTMSVINDYAGSEKRISDDAYSCNVSSDGSIVRFASGYNAETNTVSIVSYSNSNTLKLAENAGMGAFTFDKSGAYVIYASDFNNESEDGVSKAKINTVTKKAKIKNLDEGVSAYGLKNDGTVILKKVDNGSASLCRTKLKGGTPKVFAEGITDVLSY